MGMMKAGGLDRQITIKRPGPPTDDGYTTKPGALADYYTCAARWLPQTGTALFEVEGREVRAMGTLWIRYNPTSAAIREDDKVSFRGQLWTIAALPEEIGRREGISLKVIVEGPDDLPDPSS